MQRLAILSLLLLAGPAWAAGPLPLHRIKLPPGFNIALYARVPQARSLARGEKGTIFVGNRQGDKVYALAPGSRKLHVIVSGLYMPNGIAFRNGALYVAEVHRILRFDGIEARLDDPPRPKVIRDDLPSDRWHGWRYMAFGPDGWLYLAVGAPCNVCLRPDPYATIVRLRPDGSRMQVYARGVRNSVGFAWHPKSKELWFTNNGRDWLGDDQPPDSLHRAPRAGMHFGFPFCHAGTPDPEYGRRRPCPEFSPPALKLPAHVAALGMRFYTGDMFPPAYQGQILIAEHGSWNRSVKVGYRVSLVRLKGNRVVEYRPFASGWLQGESAWGRPVDLLVLPDGSLLISDDRAGAIYRVTYQAKP